MALSRREFKKIKPHLTDDINWMTVGDDKGNTKDLTFIKWPKNVPRNVLDKAQKETGNAELQRIPFDKNSDVVVIDSSKKRKIIEGFAEE